MNTQVNFETAAQLFEAGNYGDALRMGKILLREQNKSEMLLQFCGTCALKLGELREAKKHYSKLVKFYPKVAQYWSDLGFVYYTSDDFKRARHAYTQASRHDTRNAEHLLGDAICRVAEGDLAGAADQYAKALKLAPEHPRALHGLANIRRQQSRPFEAMSYLRQLSISPVNRDPGFWTEYAEVSFSITDIPETLMAIDNAHALGFNDASLDARIALLYSKMGKSEEAIAAIKRAIEKAPEDIENLNDAASIYIDAGDSEAASDMYRKIIAQQPNLAKIYFSLSQLNKFSSTSIADTALVSEMEKALNSELDDPALMHFALGKAYADLNEADKAFHHLNIGNKLRKDERPYSLQVDADRVKRLKQQFPSGSVDSQSAVVPEDTLSPIFIVGMPRSGTTLVEQIIGAHPTVTPCGELILLSHILSTHFPDDATEMTPQSWADIGELYRTQMSGLAENQLRTTDKLPHNFFNVGAIWSSMPDARVILLQRNPIDIGLSCYQACFNAGLDFTHDLAMIGGFYKLFEELCDHWKKIAPDRLLMVQYEDLVSDTDTNIRRMLDFCDLEWHPDCERYFEKHRRLGTASFNQANKPIYKSSVEKWRRYETHLQPLIKALEL